MRVFEVMTKRAVCCRESDSLHDAARIMWDVDCGFVPVVDFESRVVGVLTDRDALMAVYFQPQLLRDVRVDAVMSRNVVACHADDFIESAEGLMREHQIRRLVVVNGDGRLTGVLSLNDLANKHTPRLDLAETLSVISAPRTTAFAAE